MRKSITFSLTVEFADSINNDEDAKEVADNIVSALINEIDTGGIAPENSDTYTTGITLISAVDSIIIKRGFN
jgi:hypothetical protein